MSRMLELRRRALIAALMRKASGLPDGCIELEYIASTGPQYLDTGFIPNQDTRVVIEYAWIGKVTRTAGAVFGARTAAKSNAFMFWGQIQELGTSVRDCYGNSEINVTLTNAEAAGRIVLDKNKNVTTINGTAVTHTAQTFSSPSSMLLFATSTAGSLDGQVAAYIIWSTKVYDNGILARDYVPILDPSGVACMYDKVNKEYCYNAGTGSFIPGYKLPEGYTEREYIESTGTQFLDTGFKPNQDTRVVMNAEVTFNGNANSWHGLYGARKALGDTAFAFWITGAKGTQIDYGNNNAKDVTVSTEKITVDQNKNVTNVNGTIKTLPSATFQTAYPMYFFCTNQSGSPVYYISMKLFSSQTYDNITPARDYVPVTDANGVACAFDRIGNKTYYNAGSGSFIAGPEVTAA